MKKIARRHSVFHVICPFCETLCESRAYLAWCTGCYCEYYTRKNGDVIFDTNRKTPRFAWAKAICKSGGVQISIRSTEHETEKGGEG